MKSETVIVIAGLPITGKSSLGRALAQATGLHFVDIDEGSASCAPPQESNPIFSNETRSRERARMTVAYTVLHAAVEANLRQDFSIIISVTYSRHTNQDLLQEATKRGGGELKVIWCQYHDTPEEVGRRVADRLARGAVGGCRSVAHYLDDKRRYEGIKLPHRVSARPSNKYSRTSTTKGKGMPQFISLSHIRQNESLREAFYF